MSARTPSAGNSPAKLGPVLMLHLTNMLIGCVDNWEGALACRIATQHVYFQVLLIELRSFKAKARFQRRPKFRQIMDRNGG